ncbi:MAG: 7-cyano-7-deazaguanine synthase QueC [Proteobacteria bacterium]|nr:7-cyano-7-deazaguanine synthase QueC [Pseudomonadota bacterium]MBU4009540.1 7-cyano-7-deazaguanine synthase QueC [Pseudomonadota bacterium]
MRKKAIILLSGGLDSTTVMAIAKHEGFDLYSMSFFYGQRHSYELNAAKKVAEVFNVKKHLVINIDLNKIGGSALTADIKVPKSRSFNSIKKGIPVTYVPARNTIFLSHALAWAEVIKCFDIFIGVNAIDFSGYPDCRPEFINAFEHMANLATKAGVEGKMRINIQTPLIKMTKAQIINKGIELGVDYSLTHSCYDPEADGSACGFCDSCFLRKKGFDEAGLIDPVRYSGTL